MSKTVHSATPEPRDTPESPAMTAHQAAGYVATAARTGDSERELIARRNLAEAKIADAIDKALAVAPPLTSPQVARLTRLLRTGGQRQSNGVRR